MFDLHNANNLEILKSLPDNSVDSVVTDPPYGISFMGKKWDYDVPSVNTWKEVLRVLKPGGHILVACGTRTQHRMAVNIEDAGFEVRDIVAWVYGSGFPKSLNIGKAVDKLQGNEREFVGVFNNGMADTAMKPDKGWNANSMGKEITITKGNSPYEGWGTALKPAMELWTLARKPLSEKNIAENVLKWGTGGINIDGSRVETSKNDLQKLNSEWDREWNSNYKTYAESVGGSAGFNMNNSKIENKNLTGRFPANIIHDGSDEVIDLFPNTKSGTGAIRKNAKGMFGLGGDNQHNTEYRDSASASRFFYCAKASKNERNRGLDGFEDKNVSHDGRETYIENPYQRHDNIQKNNHPTVKPIALMKYLTKLITPVNGVVLDPYMGSGSTGIACQEQGFRFIGIELDPEYFEIAKARINNWTKQ